VFYVFTETFCRIDDYRSAHAPTLAPAKIFGNASVQSVAMRMHRDFVRIPQATALRYCLSGVLALLVLACCYALNGFASLTIFYILSCAVVALSAWYLGTISGVLATAILAVGAAYGLVNPSQSFRLNGAETFLNLAVFLFTSICIVALGEVRRRENENIRKAQAELEDRVKERTADLASANENLRELSARLLQMQDEERRRIARELHDSVGQLLVGLSMNISTVRSEIERLNKAAIVLNDSEALVQEMTKEVRTISHLLHPPLLDEAGLSSAIRWYTDGFAQRSHIKVDVDCPNDFARLPRDVETAMFRVVQECLTNIHRHSGSEVATIRCRQSEDYVVIEVTDKGQGISQEQLCAMASTGTPGVGIRGMRERLQQLGGELEITSNSHGTLVSAKLAVRGLSATESCSNPPGTSKAAA